MKRRVYIILFFLILLGLSLSIHKEKFVIVEDLDNAMINEFYTKDLTFSIGYIHSVELTPAEEFFKITKDNKVVLYKTIYESFGVGLPFSQKENRFDITKGKFVLERERVMDSIKMRISPIPKHWIVVNNVKYKLLDLIKKPEDLINIYVKEYYVFKIGKIFIKLF